MRALIDTCVIIDAITSRKPFDKDAKTIMELVAMKKIDGFVSAKTVCDVYYLVHKKTHNDAETRKCIATLLEFFSLVDTIDNDIEEAIVSDMKDYEDAVMVETASREKIDIIITRNTKDFVKSKIKALAPRELLTD